MINDNSQDERKTIRVDCDASRGLDRPDTFLKQGSRNNHSAHDARPITDVCRISRSHTLLDYFTSQKELKPFMSAVVLQHVSRRWNRSLVFVNRIVFDRLQLENVTKTEVY